MKTVLTVHILALSLLFLSGCTSDSDKQIDSLERLQKNTQENLMECKAQLEVYRGATIVNNSSEEQESAPAEPSCDTTSYYQVYSDGKFVASCTEAETTASGLKLFDCEDGFGYECLKNVKYNTKDKEICQ